MRSSRPTLSLCLAAALSACGGGGGGGATGGTPAPTPTPTTTPTPTPTTAACSLSTREDWALAQLNEWYLFPDLIDTSVNKANYTDLQSYVDALLAPARAQNKDRYFTYITSIAEENALINSGTTAGFGFRLSYYNDGTGHLEVFVNEAFEGTPAAGANIDRGDELVGVGTVGGSMLMVSSLPATNAAVQQVIDAMGPDDPSTKRVLRIQHHGGAQVDVTLNKASFNMNPLAPNGNHVINYGGTPVGYINLRTFIATTAEDQLRARFLEFKNQGVNKVIVDLRYNGGGLLEVSQVLGSLLAKNQVNNPFAYMTFRSSKSSENQTLNFQSEANAISSMKIAFIGADGTASASELVMNALPPYMGKNVALVGSNTYGKPVGQIAEDNSGCDDRFRIIAFALQNKDHYGGYFNGLADDSAHDPNSFAEKAATCSADDDIFHPLGDPAESSVATALNWLNGGSCSTITASTGKTTQSVKRKHFLVQPVRPNAAQAWMPGLF